MPDADVHVREHVPPELRWVGPVYVGLVSLAGLALLGLASHAMAQSPAEPRWLLFALLTWGSSLLAIKVPGVPATLSMSETFLFVQVLSLGAPAAVLTVAGEGVLTSLRRRDRRLVRVLFNTTEPVVSIWIASQLVALLGHQLALTPDPSSLASILLPGLVLGGAYFVSNSSLTAVAVWSDTGQSPWTIWRHHFATVSLSYLASAAIAVLVVPNLHDVTFGVVAMVVPLLVVLYVAFAAWLGRVETEKHHLRELSRTYLATVESLAMAIDAKDHTTSTHIRRVQRFAMMLARLMRVEREQDLKALEVAALLHDIGKLGVPDHILNKPGPLTAAEFAQIQRHPVIGAEILSAVSFPFPVVPIVRHHHENWDGSGYPDGLAGDAIPFGARILAVLDCHDALTSHRPYRRAMTTEAALDVIERRRGVMYDPAIVDAFVRLLPTVDSSTERQAREEDESRAPAASVVRLPRASDGPPVDADVVPPTDLVCDLIGEVADRVSFENAADIVGAHLRRATPATLVLFYATDEAAQVVYLRHASGAGTDLVHGVSMGIGDRLSGWVAAHGTTIVNTDPALDLECRVASLVPPLESALSLRVHAGAQAVGVLTLCAPGRQAFSDAHRQLAEAVGDAVGTALARACALGGSTARSTTERSLRRSAAR
ncbi:MAG: HD domain-containing protein [Vicinamibacterales bacterium]